MESCEPYYTPNGEEAYYNDNDAGRRGLDGFDEGSGFCHRGRVLAKQHQMCYSAAKYEDAVERQRDEKEVKVSVVPFAHAVANPGAVVVESLHAVVAYGAVRGPWWPKYLATEAILQFNCLVFDNYLLCAGRRPVSCALV